MTSEKECKIAGPDELQFYPMTEKLLRDDGWEGAADKIKWSVATIKALRQQVAELEGEKSEVWNCLEENERRQKSLTAENAELKRQVEALREDAEIGRIVRHVVDSERLRRLQVESFDCDGGVSYWVRWGDSEQVFSACILEALREAAKGQVEG